MPDYFRPLIDFCAILVLTEWHQSSINCFQFSMVTFRNGEFQSDGDGFLSPRRTFSDYMNTNCMPRKKMLFSETYSWLQVVGRIFIMRAIFYFVLVYIMCVRLFTSISVRFYTWKSRSFPQQLKRLKDLLVTEWHRMNCSFLPVDRLTQSESRIEHSGTVFGPLKKNSIR